MTKYEKIALALGGLFQSCDLVDQLATKGTLDPAQFTTCIKSLFITAPENILDVYGDVKQLHHGLLTLKRLLSNKAGQPNDTLRYAISILHLQKKLLKRSRILKELSDRLEQTKRQANHFHPTHESVIASLAQVYMDTISTLGPRIKVRGNPNFLQNQETANKIRALLLAAIRAAVLWQQVGGSRWQFLFNKKRIFKACTDLLENS